MLMSARSEATRRRLCLAAEWIVAANGLGQVTFRKVAEAAEQRNTAAVSYHFGSTHELLRAVVELRLRETEGERLRMIADSGMSVSALDGFTAWRCLARPLLNLADERSRHAHIRFLTQMSAAGLLSDPFDERIARPDTPSIPLLLQRVQASLGGMSPQLGRARVALCGMMFWNAVALYDEQALGQDAAIDLDILLADVEGQIKQILTPA